MRKFHVIGFCNGLTRRMGFCGNDMTAGMQKCGCLLEKLLKQGSFEEKI